MSRSASTRPPGRRWVSNADHGHPSPQDHAPRTRVATCTEISVNDLAAVCERVGLTAATVADPDGSTCAAETVRLALTRTLAIALVAARASGKYDWTSPVDLDELVAAAAWDHLDQLATEPVAP